MKHCRIFSWLHYQRFSFLSQQGMSCYPDMHFFCTNWSMDGEKFERRFVEEACKAGKEDYGTIKQYAQAIWPEKEEKTATQTLYAIQGKSSKTGKPQSLKLSEAVRMVEVLQKNNSFPSFCFKVSELLKIEDETPRDKALSVKTQKKEGKTEQPLSNFIKTETTLDEAPDGR